MAVEVRQSEGRETNAFHHPVALRDRGIRSHVKNKAARVLFGFRQWDKVRYKSQKYFIKARRLSGYFSLSDISGSMAVLDGKKLGSVKHSGLVLVENAATLLRNAAYSANGDPAAGRKLA